MPPSAPLLDDMVLFVEVASAGGITAAAERLKLRKSTVSRRLSALEARLGVRLLERTTRNVRLTEAGRSYQAQCVRIVSEARALNHSMSEAKGAPHGTLRIATFSLMGELLAPLVSEFLLRHQQVRVELSLSQAHVDLVATEHDLALRTGPLVDSSLVTRKLGGLRTGYFASPAYLSRRGEPRRPDDLAAHDCVLLSEPGTDEVWFFTGARGGRTVAVDGRLRVPNLRAGQAAARAGLGIVSLPEWLAAEELRSGALVPVLAEVTPPALPVYALWPSARHVPAKVRRFLELLEERRATLPWV